MTLHEHLTFADDLRVELLKYKSLTRLKLDRNPTKDVQTEAGCQDWLECFGLSADFDRDTLTVTLGVGLEYEPAELIAVLAVAVEQHLAAHETFWYKEIMKVSLNTAQRWKRTGQMPAKHWPIRVTLCSDLTR